MGKAIGFAAAIFILMLLLYCMAPEPSAPSLSVPNDDSGVVEAEDTVPATNDEVTTD